MIWAHPRPSRRAAPWPRQLHWIFRGAYSGITHEHAAYVPPTHSHLFVLRIAGPTAEDAVSRARGAAPRELACAARVRRRATWIIRRRGSQGWNCVRLEREPMIGRATKPFEPARGRIDETRTASRHGARDLIGADTLLPLARAGSSVERLRGTVGRVAVRSVKGSQIFGRPRAGARDVGAADARAGPFARSLKAARLCTILHAVAQLLRCVGARDGRAGHCSGQGARAARRAARDLRVPTFRGRNGSGLSTIRPVTGRAGAPIDGMRRPPHHHECFRKLSYQSCCFGARPLFPSLASH